MIPNNLLGASPSSMEIVVLSERQPGGNSMLTEPSGVSTVPPAGPTVPLAEVHNPGVHETPLLILYVAPVVNSL